MERKVLFSLGNLGMPEGYPWGVEAELQFGTREIHGPFVSENAASNYAHGLTETIPENGPYATIKVVRFELPQVGKLIVQAADGEGVNGTGYQYA